MGLDETSDTRGRIARQMYHVLLLRRVNAGDLSYRPNSCAMYALT